MPAHVPQERLADGSRYSHLSGQARILVLDWSFQETEEVQS